MFFRRSRLSLALASVGLLWSQVLWADLPPDLSAAIKQAKAQAQQSKNPGLRAVGAHRPLLRAPLFGPLRSGVKQPAIHWRANGTPAQIEGALLQAAVPLRSADVAVRDRLTAQHFLRLNRALLKLADPDRELALTEYQPDALQGGARLRFAQQSHGLPVWPAELALYTDRQGNLTRLSGAYVPTPRHPLNAKPQVSAEAVHAQVTAHYPAGTTVTQPVKIIYAPGDRPARLAWRCQALVAADRRMWVVVDALTGTWLAEFNQIHAVAASGAGEDLLGQVRPLQVFEEAGQYQLANTSKVMFSQAGLSAPSLEKGTIQVLDAAGQDPDLVSFAPNPIFSSSANGGYLKDGVSAAYNLSEVYDYFLERHQRNALDGRGSSMLGIVRVGQNFDNAFWNGKAMYFGNAMPYAASLDVVGHELTHGVVEHTAGLIYENQSGALNEAFADIFGEMVQARTKGQPDWVTGGDELGGLIIRSFSEPEKYDQPSRMSDFRQMPNTGDGDNGGVHYNSGIINHAFYLLAAGMEGAIGLAEAEQIFYRVLSLYLTNNAQFIDARLAAVQAAGDLFGAESVQAQKVGEAFDAVGITGDDPGTQMPPSFPPVSQAADAVLFACLTDLGTTRVCRIDPGLGEESAVVLSETDLDITRRISVQGDGQMAAFVSMTDDLCFINTTSGVEGCLGLPGTVNSVAVSPDGNRYALVEINDLGEVDNRITVIDLAADSQVSYELFAPASDGAAPTNSIAMADSLAFSADSQTLYYDAENVFRSAEGENSAAWTIYTLDLDTGNIRTLMQPVPDLDIGFPMLSSTSDNFMTFDAFDQITGLLQVNTMDLSAGEIAVVAEFESTYSLPTYNGDDSQLVYMMPDMTATLGFQVIVQNLQADRMTPDGQPQAWLTEAAAPALYRIGQYLGEIPVSGYFDLDTSILRFELAYPSEAGEMAFQLDLKLTGMADANTLSFTLLDFQMLEAASGQGASLYENSVFLPVISLTDALGNTSYLNLLLQLAPLPNGQLGFTLALSDVVPLF